MKVHPPDPYQKDKDLLNKGGKSQLLKLCNPQPGFHFCPSPCLAPISAKPDPSTSYANSHPRIKLVFLFLFR